MLPQPEPASPPVTESAEPVECWPMRRTSTRRRPAARGDSDGICRAPGWGKDDEYIKRVIETLSYERAHDLSLWLTDRRTSMKRRAPLVTPPATAQVSAARFSGPAGVMRIAR